MEYRIRGEYKYCVIEVKTKKRCGFLWLSKKDVWVRANIIGNPILLGALHFNGMPCNEKYEGIERIEEAKLQIEKWNKAKSFESKYYYV